MGCLPSKFTSIFLSGGQSVEDNADDTTNKTYSWDKRQKIDPAEYTIENIENDEAGRVPGTINGQQFIVQNCRSAKIYLFDHINTVTIDDCSDCSLYVGPVAGSLFIRNCKNCRVVAACGQFRTRDCSKMSVLLYCQTKPIIEASTAMKFGCFQSNYSLLNDHFQKAGLNMFNNSWADVHDFTPTSETEKNWTVMKNDELISMQGSFTLPQKDDLAKVGLTFKRDASLVPITGGSAQHESKDVCLIICFYNDKNYHENALDIISKMRKDKFVIQCTCEIKMEKSEVLKFFGGSFLGKMAQKGPVVALLCTGSGVVEEAKKTASLLNSGKKNPIAYTTDGTEEGVNQVDLFFSFVAGTIGM